MTQSILENYDEFITNATDELTEKFEEAIANPLSFECVLSQTEEWLDDNKTRLLQEIYRVAKPNPDQMRFLLEQLIKQFSSYQLLALSLFESFDELFPEEDETQSSKS